MATATANATFFTLSLSTNYTGKFVMKSVSFGMFTL